MQNLFVKNEIDEIVAHIKDVEWLRNKSILVTGATGFIGSYLIKVLVSLNDANDLKLSIYAIARSKEKAQKEDIFDKINWHFCNMSDKIDISEHIDYIIHTASPTDSKGFINQPVETINQPISWINNLMELAIKNKIDGMVFLSSLEVYGVCVEDKFLSEKDSYKIDCTNIRSSYPEGKRLIECLCCSYAAEYNVPVKIVRLGQTFGPGILASDNRVFAQFARAIANKEDIVLLTKGETKRSYCSIVDAVLGIIIALENGKPGIAYNLASDDSYISIYEMAELFTNGTDSKIRIEEAEHNEYLETIKFGLDTKAIKAIGFNSTKSIKKSIPEFIEYFNDLIK